MCEVAPRLWPVPHPPFHSPAYLEVELCGCSLEVDPRLRYVHHIGAPGGVPELGRGLAVKKQLAALKIGWGRGAEGGGCPAECVCVWGGGRKGRG